MFSTKLIIAPINKAAMQPKKGVPPHVTHLMTHLTHKDLQSVPGPRSTIKAIKALPALSIPKYTGTEEERHMIAMWIPINQLYLSFAEDVGMSQDFSDGVAPDF